MKTLLTACLVLLCACTQITIAQRNTPFPPLVGETLTGQAVEVPIQRDAKPTIIGLAYSKKAEDDGMDID